MHRVIQRGGLLGVEQRAPGVRGRHAHHRGGRARADHSAARVPGLGPQIDDPIRGAHHIQIVFDYQQ